MQGPHTQWVLSNRWRSPLLTREESVGSGRSFGIHSVGCQPCTPPTLIRKHPCVWGAVSTNLAKPGASPEKLHRQAEGRGVHGDTPARSPQSRAVSAELSK